MSDPRSAPLPDTLFGKTLEELTILTQSLGMPRFSAAQISGWLYKKHAASIDEMTDISKDRRALLSRAFTVGRIPPESTTASRDGTVKYLFPVHGGKTVEAVWLPEETRGTLCLSTQSGCKMGCAFCMTGRMGFDGNLTAGEICNQYASNPFRDRITNIVYMGMGEPLDNLDQTMQSLEVFTAEWGYAMSPTRITVSTIGVLPALETFLRQSRCHLAVSLHSPFDAERKELMPVQKTWPAKEILKTLKTYDWSGQRRLSFEYIMFDGINDSPEHAKELVRLVSGVKCRINLLHYHALPGSDLQGSPTIRMEEFQNILKNKGVMTTIRKSRGEDILAACGLLSTTQNNMMDPPSPPLPQGHRL